MELHGVTGSPYKHPEVRKKLPAPFARPMIDLDGGTHRKRSWKDTPVIDIKAGDVVADIGRVASVQEFIALPGSDLNAVQEQQVEFWRVRITNVFAEYWDFGGHQRLYAFTEDPE